MLYRLSYMGKLRKVFMLVVGFSDFAASKKAKQPVTVNPVVYGSTVCGLRSFFAASGFYASEAALCQRSFSQDSAIGASFGF